MNNQFYRSYFELEKTHWWFRVRRNLIVSLLKRIEPKTVVDIGCGSGYLIGELQKAGYDAHGADSYGPAVAFGKEKGIANLRAEQSDALSFASGSTDVVLALDVLEHLKDEAPTIREMERILKPGGIAIITVPAFRFLWGVQDEVAHHFRRYRLGELERVVMRNGNFNVHQKTYFNTFLFPAIAGVRLVSKWFGLKSRESDFEIHNRFLNSILFRIFNMEVKLLKYIGFPFGVSALLVVQKKLRNGEIEKLSKI